MLRILLADRRRSNRRGVQGVQACGLRRVRRDASTGRPCTVPDVQSTAAKAAAAVACDFACLPLHRPSLSETLPRNVRTHIQCFQERQPEAMGSPGM